MLMMANAMPVRQRGLVDRWLAIGVFMAANLIRLALLRGTGEQSLQVDYVLIPLTYWMTRHLRMRWAVQMAAGSIVAALVIGGDLLDIMSRRFNWSHGVVIDYAYSMPDLPWPTILPFLALGLVAVALSVMPFAFDRGIFAIWPLLLVVCGLLLANSVMYNGVRGDVDTSRLTRSFVSHAATGAYNRLIVGRTLTPFVGDSMARDLSVAAPPAQILSVAVESFGLANDSVQRASLVQPLLLGVGSRYVVTQGAHPFRGSTQPGEIRELCALQAEGIPNTPLLLARLDGCLPANLRRGGYDTQALHGNGPLMYDRRVIYPAVGFARTWFDTDLRRELANVGPCSGTAFGGVCDADLFARALSLFDGHRRFVHVMTLDAHLPLKGSAPPQCPTAFAMEEGLCRYAQVTRASFAALARQIAAARHPPDLIVIYGDHAPPFAAIQARHVFSQRAVPYLVLRRRAELTIVH